MKAWRAFSSPFEGNFLELSQLSVQKMLKATVASLTTKENSRSKLDTLEEEIDLIADKIRTTIPSTAWWTPEVGTARLCGGAYGQEAARIQLAVAGFLFGWLDSLNVNLIDNTPLVVAGHVVIGDSLHIAADGSSIKVLSRKSNSCCLRLTKLITPGIADVWVQTGDDDALIVAGDSAKLLVTGGEWEKQFDKHFSNEAIGPTMPFRVQMQEAFKALQNLSEHYYLWTLVLLRELMPIKRPAPHATSSASNSIKIGNIALSHPASEWETIEMLIHECSHQFASLTQLFSPLTRENSPEIFSVLKGVRRPLDKVLIGYHAFGNICLFYDQLNRSNESEIKARMKHHWGIVQSLEEGLREPVINSCLTEAGNCLYEPLRVRLIEARERAACL